MVQFEEVVAQFGPALARVAASYAYGAAEREDLLQDILLAVWRALPRFAGRSSLRTYVFRIAHNRGLSLARARKPVHACDSEQLRPDPSPDPEQRAVMSDELSLVACCRRTADRTEAGADTRARRSDAPGSRRRARPRRGQRIDASIPGAAGAQGNTGERPWWMISRGGQRSGRPCRW